MPRHFIELADYTPTEIAALLDLATALKTELRAGGHAPRLRGQQLGMVFQKPSLRTRVSFEVGMRQLGGDALYLSPNEVGLGQRESIADVARVLSRYVNIIMARVFDHAHVKELAQWASVPVINGLSDYNHPCQAMADLLTIREHKGRLAGLKLTYVGDGNNVATSLAFASALVGLHFHIATPEQFTLPLDVVTNARELGAATGMTLTEHHDPVAAVTDADVVYTDTWVSMGQETEAELRRQVFPPYQLNTALLSHAKPDAIVMHDLPAYRGYEITNDVADSPQSVIFDQAENRMHAQKAILVSLLEAQ